MQAKDVRKTQKNARNSLCASGISHNLILTWTHTGICGCVRWLRGNRLSISVGFRPQILAWNLTNVCVTAEDIAIISSLLSFTIKFIFESDYLTMLYMMPPFLMILLEDTIKGRAITQWAACFYCDSPKYTQLGLFYKNIM